jgi:hypothetical protein
MSSECDMQRPSENKGLHSAPDPCFSACLTAHSPGPGFQPDIHNKKLTERVMSKHDQHDPDDLPPVGTWALMCMVAAAMAAAWLFLYFGVFLPRGTVQ